MRRSVLTAVLVTAAASPSAAGAHVLRVGTYKGVPGQFSTIQAAVHAAKPNDWVLVAPGDYKTTASTAPSGAPQFPTGVLITQSGLYLRGMNRNSVIVDGTKSGPACSPNRSDQNFGPTLSGQSKPAGLNGVLVWKANNVWVQNMTVCNFLGGSTSDGGGSGNEVWWNGGANTYGTTGGIGGHGYFGSNLNATSTYFGDESTAAQYGIFSSNWSGGTWDQTYASNFNDSGYYIGACQQVCNQTVNHAWGEYSALGYSGSNSGGQLVIENSQFDNNEDGFDTNSQNGDNPPPQNGACPNNGISPITHTHSCWVFMHNNVHDNNNPNVPAAGSAAAGPVGTGMSVSGGRNDTIMDNTFSNNDAWGIILVPYLDSGPPCTGGSTSAIPGSCLFDEWGDAILNNQFSHNGSYGHPSNGDFAQDNFLTGNPSDCYSGNTEVGGGKLTPDAAAEQTRHPTCSGTQGAESSNPLFLPEVLCDSQVELVAGVPSACPTGQYPRRTKVVMHALPPAAQLATMAKPCSGVPSDPWCSGQRVKIRRCVAAIVRVKLSVDPGEKLTSVTVFNHQGGSVSFPAHGSSTKIRLALGGSHHKKFTVHVIEHVKVGSHRETISFFNVYTRC